MTLWTSGNRRYSAHISYRDHRYADAVKFFSKFQQKQREFELTDPDSLQGYGSALYEVKRFDDAVPVLQKGLERVKTGDNESSRPFLILIGQMLQRIETVLEGRGDAGNGDAVHQGRREKRAFI